MQFTIAKKRRAHKEETDLSMNDCRNRLLGAQEKNVIFCHSINE